MYKKYKNHYVKIFTDAPQHPIYYGLVESILEKSVNLYVGLNEKELVKGGDSKSLISIIDDFGIFRSISLDRVISISFIRKDSKI